MSGKIIFVLIITAIGMSGCALNGPVPIADWHLDHNEEIAIGERQMIVRNILRARDQESMVFTRVDSLNGNITQQARGTLGASILEGPHNDTLSPGFYYQFETDPSWSIAVRDSQEFWRGISRPIDIGLHGHFLSQGWPDYLFAYLFIEEIQLVDRDQNESVLSNDPDDRFNGTQEQRNGFDDWVANLYRSGYRLSVCRTGGTLVGPVLSTPYELEQVVQVVDHSRLSFEPVDPLTGRSGPAGSAISNNHGATARYRLERSGTYEICIVKHKDPSIRFVNRNGSFQLDDETGEVRNLVSNSAFETITSIEHIQLRSLQRAIYYVGEVLRYRDEGGYLISVPDSSPSTPSGDVVLREQILFGLSRSAHPNGGFSVTHHGGEYHSVYQNRGVARRPCAALPQLGGSCDSSQVVITLLLQLVALHQSATSAPTAANVRVIN